MGYFVGRWEGDTLVVGSFGFNDRTWLNDRGLPHTEALRMTQRYQRRDLGHLRIDFIFTDTSAYTKPLTLMVNMQLAADTEILEAVCETSSDHWGTPSERTSAVRVAPDVLAKYIGSYSGFWAHRRLVRTVPTSRSLGPRGRFIAAFGLEDFQAAPKCSTHHAAPRRFVFTGNEAVDLLQLGALDPHPDGGLFDCGCHPTKPRRAEKRKGAL